MSWCDLPGDLVSGIADRITEHTDLTRFRSVCPWWRSASAVQAARGRVPLLLVPSLLHANRRLWSLADDSVVETPFPAASGFSFLYASPCGWTLGVAPDGLAATLLHPLTGASESLPALPDCFHDKGRRILRDMVWDRSPDAVVVSSGKGAFFCRLRPVVDESWSPVTGCSQQDGGHTSSITYCDGTFYLLDGRARRVIAVDGTTFAGAAVIEPPPPDMVTPVLSPSCEPESTLIASASELLLIVRTRLLLDVGSLSSDRIFKVFRADPRNLATGWSDVTDGGGIGDRAVFVDHLRGFCVEANGLNGVKRNSMYVASAYSVVDGDFGMDVCGTYTVSVLDLADLTIENLGYGNLIRKCRDGRLWQWPSWFMPNLH